MKYLRKIFIIPLCLFLLISFTSIIPVGCNTQDNTDYSTIYKGIWEAEAIEQEEIKSIASTTTMTYRYVFAYKFLDNGLYQKRAIMYLNSSLYYDSDWMTQNTTWSAEKNKIHLSDGTTYVVLDDEFTDVFQTKQTHILHYQHTMN